MSSKTDAQRALEVIRAYPLASLLGAVAAGFLAARFVRKSER
jgi:hypothetical protein